MPQNAPIPPSHFQRPLPQFSRGPSPKTTRPRIVWADGLWLSALPALAVIIAALVHGPIITTGTKLAAITVALIYFIGWRARDRATGIAAALLLATSLPFANAAAGAVTPDSLKPILFLLLTVTALAAFVAGSAPVALIVAGAATVVRLDGFALASLLLIVAASHHQRRLWIGALAYLGVVVAWLTDILITHQKLQPPLFHPHLDTLTWMAVPALMFLGWFLIPFVADLGESTRRARWMPILFWTVLLLVCESLFDFQDHSANTSMLLLAPLFFLLIGGGISRLLPVIAGETPAIRYLLATLAILSIIAIRANMEWRDIWATAHPSVAAIHGTRAQPSTVPTKPAKPGQSVGDNSQGKEPLPAPITSPVVMPIKPKQPSAVQPTRPVPPSASQTTLHTPLSKPIKSGAIKAPVKPHAATPHTTLGAPKIKATPTPVPHPAVKPVAPHAAVIAKPTPHAAAPAKPSVKRSAPRVRRHVAKPAKRIQGAYIRRNGKLTHRSKWAILWEQRHKH